MRTVKLYTHQKNYNKDDIIIYQKDFPEIKIGDLVEIYSPEDNYSRLLVQIKRFHNKNQPKDSKVTISIEQSIAMAFQLRKFTEVIMNVVDPETVVLDSVELFFKDQYLARSDMWRLKKYITNTSVYLNKKIEFNNIRCQVFEMWSHGLRMASGYINEETKVVFRSASSMVYLFLQMSSEMWDYDINGDLYFEKAVKGFLTDLFNKWKRFNCSHDVTIVLFSRTFFDAADINEFPEPMRYCLQQDSKGRFYEDYYRVAVQNERFEDWSPTLIYLRKLFCLYEEEVIHSHENRGYKVPKAYNSTASQGNFLEVLNMSLNVFERHNLDRSFDRTGQLSVVISPGVGVYEVDLDLTNVTKQRIIDNGIGSDLVCLGEQPLHAVPLFKFNSKHPKMLNDEYNMPHWINLSFYSSKQRLSFNFIPRIKMPNILQTKSDQLPKKNTIHLTNLINNENKNESPIKDNCSVQSSNTNGIDLKSCQHISFIDYDEFDNQIFRNSMSIKHSIQTVSSKSSTLFLEESPTNTNDTISKRRLSEVISVWSDNHNNSPPGSPLKGDDVDGLSILYDRTHSSSLSTSIETKNTKDYKFRIESKDDIIVHNYKNRIHRTKALINPFDPSHVTIKLNSNRRRWTHVFPLGPTGIFMQQHHYQAIPHNTAGTILPYVYNSDTSLDLFQKGKSDLEHFKRSSFDQTDGNANIIDSKEKDQKNKAKSRNSNEIENRSKISFSECIDAPQKQRNLVLTDNSSLWAWGATGEQEWTSAITTGVDWKSLVMPACLPITTDFLPDKRTLQQDYVTYVYDLLPEVQSVELDQSKLTKPEDNFKKNLNIAIDHFYMELICQRLQQGFQIILLPKNESRYTFSDRTGNKYHYILSIGRIYHELAHKENRISIIYYHPRHPYKVHNIIYCYRIRTPDNETYGVSWVEFTSEKLETYKWNYLDNYICLNGDTSDYQLIESLKYWRFRLLVLPTMQSKTKKIIDKYTSGQDDFQCDLYDVFSFEEKIELQAGFLRLVEAINRIKRALNKQSSRSDQNKNTLNRRYSSAAINSNVVESNNSHNRHSQPSSAILSVINESNQSKLDNFSMKSDDSKQTLTNTTKSTENDLSGTFESETSSTKGLSKNSPHKDILDYMVTSNSLFFINSKDLPAYTFVSSDAINWAIANIDLIQTEENAEILFQSFVINNMIRHASGDANKQFKRGFHLYCIMTEKNVNYFNKHGFDHRSFERAWMEVGVVYQHSNFKNYEMWYENSNELISNHYPIETPEFTFKNFTQYLDNKNGRVEWVNVKYHSMYDPEQAFELIIEWMVATGNAIPEIVTTWTRTKNTGLHIVPIPWDPFALPFSSKSDPLRGPIYISLNIDCLSSETSQIMEGDWLFNFQEKILIKFGFMPFHDPNTENQRQFVHVSGSIFVLIPSKSSSNLKNLNKRGKFLKSVEMDAGSSPHEEYITRHFSGVQQKGQDSHIDTKIGFLWCWNYMITKRWKTNMTGDENSMRKIMYDFRGFCSNKNDRLRTFWEIFKAKETNESNDQTEI